MTCLNVAPTVGAKTNFLSAEASPPDAGVSDDLELDAHPKARGALRTAATRILLMFASIPSFAR